MEYGCLKNRKLDIINGVLMTVYSRMERKKNGIFALIVFGKRHDIQYWQVTTDPETLPDNSTWFIMTKVPGIKYKEVGNLYGLRNWVEYGLKQSKNELGWADFRVTDYSQIQNWWEIVMSAYLIVSLHAQVLNKNLQQGIDKHTYPVVAKFPQILHLKNLM